MNGPHAEITEERHGGEPDALRQKMSTKGPSGLAEYRPRHIQRISRVTCVPYPPTLPRHNCGCTERLPRGG